MSAGGPAASANSGSEKDAAAKPAQPSVIRIRGGDLKYSGAERKALMNAGALGTVVAETGTATSVSNQVEVFLLPPGNHAGKDGGQAQVDRLTARGQRVGRVCVDRDRRRAPADDRSGARKRNRRSFDFP